MASEERRTISTEELIKELESAVWNYGAAGRDNIIKKYGVEAYEAAQTAIHEEVREKARLSLRAQPATPNSGEIWSCSYSRY